VVVDRNSVRLDVQFSTLSFTPGPVQVPAIEIVIGLKVQDRRDAELGFQVIDVAGVGRA
jgi:hypothetical protein